MTVRAPDGLCMAARTLRQVRFVEVTPFETIAFTGALPCTIASAMVASSLVVSFSTYRLTWVSTIGHALLTAHCAALLQWLQLVVSSLTFIFVPIVSGVSDTVGRRVIISWAFIFHSTAAFALAWTPNSLISVVVCDVVAGLANVIIPVSQSIMIDVVR